MATAEVNITGAVTPCGLDHGSFVFISYAHDDKKFLLPIISNLHTQGYAIWFDQGINISSTWTDEIALAILNCRVFIVFISRASMASQFVRKEIEFALNNQKTIVPVYLDDPGILPAGLALGLTATQGVVNILVPELIVEKIAAALEYNQVARGDQAGAPQVRYRKHRRLTKRNLKYAAAAALTFGLIGLALVLFFGRGQGREFVGAWGGTVNEHLAYPGSPPEYLYEITHNSGNNFNVSITKCSPGSLPRAEWSPNMPIVYNPETGAMNINVGRYSSNGVIDRETGEMVLRAMRMVRVDPEEIKRQWAEERRKTRARIDRVKAILSATTLKLDQIKGLELAGIKLEDNFRATEKKLYASTEGYKCDSPMMTILLCRLADSDGNTVEALTIGAAVSIEQMIQQRLAKQPVKIEHIGWAKKFPAGEAPSAEEAHLSLTNTLAGQLGRAPGQVEQTPEDITAYWMFDRQGRFVSEDSEHFQACRQARPEIGPNIWLSNEDQPAGWEPMEGLPSIGLPPARDLDVLCGLDVKAVIAKNGEAAVGLAVTMTHKAAHYDERRLLPSQ